MRLNEIVEDLPPASAPAFTPSAAARPSATTGTFPASIAAHYTAF